MSVSFMFSEFVGFLTYIFNVFFDSKYLVLLIGVGAALCVSMIRFVVGWFNNA